MQSGILVLCLASTALCMEHVYMERAKMEDQASGSSGYAYSSDDGGPMDYIHYSDTSGDFEHIMYPYATGLMPGHYEYHHIPIMDDVDMIYVPQYHLDTKYNSYGYPTALDEIDFDRIKYGFGNHDFTSGSGGSHNHGISSDFNSGGGASHNDEEYSTKGEKGVDAFSKLFGWDKASKGQHADENNKGWYGAEGSNRKGNQEESSQWGSNEEAARGEKGEHFNEEKGHKKGTKTSGYHKVYHKDEFKKDHEFYDKADRKGYFDKYGSQDAAHAQRSGEVEAGGHHTSGHHEDESSKKGHHDAGYHEEGEKGHVGEHGENIFHKNYEDFAKTAGEKGETEYGNRDQGGDIWKYY